LGEPVGWFDVAGAEVTGLQLFLLQSPGFFTSTFLNMIGTEIGITATAIGWGYGLIIAGLIGLWWFMIQAISYKLDSRNKTK
jgi:hypothetical protein